tara:strand:+ start:1330 stop:1833 length:504 start_codon:yes stop_codon:yes gene_type:complete
MSENGFCPCGNFGVLGEDCPLCGKPFASDANTISPENAGLSADDLGDHKDSDVKEFIAKYSRVWYLPEENLWRDNRKNMFAMRDSGTLVVNNDSLVFTGKKEEVRIANIKKISYGKQGRDSVNNWVKVEYQDGLTAFFADGSWLGWSGILGGTKKILNDVQGLVEPS